MLIVYLLVVVLPLAQHPLLAGAGDEFSAFKYLGFGAFLYATYYLFAVRTLRFRFLSQWQVRLFLPFFLIAIISAITHGYRASVAPLLSLVSFLIFFFVIAAVVDSLQRLRWLLMTMGISVALASLYVVREWQLYHALYAGFRPGWITGDSNYFAVSAIACLPIAYSQMIDRWSRWERCFWICTFIVTLVAVTLAASRGGLLGMIAAFLFVVWHSGRRFRNLALTVVLLVPVTVLLPSSPLDRLLHPSYGDELATENRTVVWRAGLRMIQQHPLVGIGLGNFKPQVVSYEREDENVVNLAHNAYIEVCAELGMPGALLFSGILISTYLSLRKVRLRVAESGPRLLDRTALGMQASLVGSAIAISFCPGTYQKSLWFLVAMSLALPALASAQRARLPRPGSRSEEGSTTKCRQAGLLEQEASVQHT